MDTGAVLGRLSRLFGSLATGTCTLPNCSGVNS